MRVGHNPMINASAAALPEVIAAVITHLPKLKGYHEQRLEVVQFCLNSLRANAGRELPVLVWDNGSCAELRTWLQDEYRPDYLIETPNVGKSSARAAILRMFPPGTVVCLTDDDMYFYPDWLAPQLELLQTFPNVGAVSGWPVRIAEIISLTITIHWAQTQATVKTGNFISRQELDDFATSIGYEHPERFSQRMSAVEDLLIEYQGLRAYANSQHCQFLCYAERIAPLAIWSREAVANEKPFDAAINAAGLLRLTTAQRYTRHIGNILDENFRRSIGGKHEKNESNQSQRSGGRNPAG